MIKVLYFVDRMLKGGIQSLVIEIVKNINKEKVQIDFLLLDDGKEYELENTLKDLGCKIYKLNGIWINTPLDFLKYKKVLDKFFKVHNDYDVVHMHSSSKNYMVLKKAKKYGIPVRIAHSHNIDFQTKNPIKKFIGNIFKIYLKKYSTDYFACSKISGEWLFGDKIVNSDKFHVIHNAIDYDKFKFNEEKRNTIRKELDIKDDELVIGHVGRFSEQKNHEFLIDIFNEIYKKRKNSKLLLIGKGEKENIIKEKVKNLNLESRVIFLGFKENVSNYYNSMDLFLLPSKFEGLPVTLVEAQANGLPIFTSKRVVTEEVKLCNNLYFIELGKNAEEWAKEILEKDMSRLNTFQDFKNNKYFIEDTVNFLEKFYENNSKRK